jgi:hypothetical protein
MAMGTLQKGFAMSSKPTLFEALRVLYPGELGKKTLYFFRKKTGYFKRIHRRKILQAPSFRPLDLLSFLSLPEYQTIDPNFHIFGQSFSLETFSFEPQNKLWCDVLVSDFHDIKIPWELSRLQFLLPYAVYVYENKDSTGFYLAQIERVLKDWLIKNPFEIGVGWSANLNVSIRFLSLYLLRALLSKKSIDFDFDLALYEHGLFISREIDYSAKCSPNNHLYGEAVSLLLFGISFDLPQEVKKANRYLLQIKDLIREDGSSKENSSGYQLFVTQMLSIQYLCQPSPSLKNKLEKSALSLETISYGGSIVKFGDCDDGFYYNFFQDTIPSIRKLCLKDFSAIRAKNGVFENENFFSIREGKNGLFILKGQEGGHGHSDGGSVFFFSLDMPVFLDPGVSSYNSDSNVRIQERSSSFHNSPCLGGHDHTTQIATFRWAKKRCITTIKSQTFHDHISLFCLIGGNIRRSIVLSNDYSCLQISDEVIPNSKKIQIWSRFLLPSKSPFFSYIAKGEDVSQGETLYYPFYGKAEECHFISLKSYSCNCLKIECGKIKK